MFVLHPQLENDTFPIIELPLSKLLLMNDKRFPWLILVPKRKDISEIYQLESVDQKIFWRETTIAAEWAKSFFMADKMNIAALGNVVPQLHMHVVARKKTDLLWPKPIWGMDKSIPYDSEHIQILINKMQHSLSAFVGTKVF